MAQKNQTHEARIKALEDWKAQLEDNAKALLECRYPTIDQYEAQSENPYNNSLYKHLVRSRETPIGFEIHAPVRRKWWAFWK